MLSRKNKEETGKVQGAINRAVNYELTIADLAKRSEKRAWQIAAAFGVLSLILAGGYFMLLPLKERTPFIVMADPYSGNVQASRLVPDVMDRQISGNEALAKSFVSRYVLARESFDADLLRTPLGGWREVNLMSRGGVGQEYRARFARENPANPLVIYGKQTAIRVKILSIVMMKAANGRDYHGATVRFQRVLFDKKSGVTRPLDNKLATIEYEYNRDLRLDDQDRVINPLGFQVTNYRVDNDFSSLPPAETPPPAQQVGGTSDPLAPPPAAGTDPAGIPSEPSTAQGQEATNNGDTSQ